jgi:hypothetical protein
MANNQLKMTCKARHLFFIPLLFLTSIINGQHISRYYTSSLQEKGTLYFIFPQSGFSNDKIKGEFIYDITCLTKNDTATLNFSYFEKSNRDIDSIAFVGIYKKYSGSVKKIFIETKKQKWHYRYTSKILFADLYDFFNQSDKPKIILYTQQGVVELTIKARIWKKRSSVTGKILTLIKYNQ